MAAKKSKPVVSAKILNFPCKPNPVSETLLDLKNVMAAQLADCVVYSLVMKDGSVMHGWDGDIDSHTPQAYFGLVKLAQKLLARQD